MKQKISYNSVISGLTIAYLVVFVAIFVLFWVFINKPFDNVFFWILVGLFCLSLLWICCSVPYSVDADDDYVYEQRPLNSRKYRMSDIKSVRKASSEEDRRMNFHGKYKYPVLITLKDGREVIIGSEDPTQLIDYINSRVS